MAQVFIKKKSGQILGPIESNQLKAMVADGSLVQDDQLAKTKDGAWKSASQVKGLFGVPEQQIPNATVGNPKATANKEFNKNLIKCKICGEMLAKTAATCPHCGHQQMSKSVGVTIVAWGFFIIFMLVCLAIVSCNM